MVRRAQERKGHINLNPRDTGRVSLGHPAGQTGVFRPVSQGLLLFAIEKRTEKGIFAGTLAGCPRDTRPSRRFSETLCFFSYVPFLLPKSSCSSGMLTLPDTAPSKTTPRKPLSPLPQSSQRGRIRFRRVRFQTPNSVSFLALTEFRGESSVSSSQNTFCLPSRTHRVCRRTQ